MEIKITAHTFHNRSGKILLRIYQHKLLKPEKIATGLHTDLASKISFAHSKQALLSLPRISCQAAGNAILCFRFTLPDIPLTRHTPV